MAEQVIDHVEARLARRPIDTRDIDELAEIALDVIAQKGQQPDHNVGIAMDRQLAICHHGPRG